MEPGSTSESPSAPSADPSAGPSSTRPGARRSGGRGGLGIDPHGWDADVVLRDGSVCHLRPIRPEDKDAVQAFHMRQSAESVYLRFFAPIKQLSARDLDRFTVVDNVSRVGLVATVRDEIIGIGRFDLIDADKAEVAFNISDHYQGKGIGSVLLEHLAAIGLELGVKEFVADVLPQNRKMMNVFTDAGYEVSHHFEDGVIAVSFEIAPTVRSEVVRLSREHRAESMSIRTLLAPRSVVVVGASRRPDSAGHRILADILDYGFTGSVYVVHPEADELLGLTPYRRIVDIGEPVDLAVIAVPAEQALACVEDCAAAGVRSLVVLSAGFAEAGEAGRRLQLELRDAAHRGGMRVLGPHSYGLVNTDPQVRLNATTVADVPPAGHLGLFVQSGVLAVAVLGSAERRGIGVSSAASAGNRLDVSGNDLMQYWIDDDATIAVGMHLESVGNPRKFSRARQLGLAKPVIVVKSGYSGYSVPPGQTVRRAHVPPGAFEAMMDQAGVIRVENVHQMFDVAQLVVHQPLPAGDRVAIVGNTGALGALAADAALSQGLRLATEPTTLAPDVSEDEVTSMLLTLLDNPDVDSVLTTFVAPGVGVERDFSGAIVRAVRHAALAPKPVLAITLNRRGMFPELAIGTEPAEQTPEQQAPEQQPDERTRRRPERIVPAYSMPEDAVVALARATTYALWLATDQGERLTYPDIDRFRAFAVIDRVLSESPNGRQLEPAEVHELLDAYGLPVWESVPVASAEEAVAAADRLGYPVVIKATSEALRHLPGIGALRLDLDDAEAVREAFAALTARFTAGGSRGDDPGWVVQRMTGPGVACVVSSQENRLFGPIVSFSVAGPPTELLDDIAYRIPPLTDVSVRELIGTVKAYPLLDGHRGVDPVDQDALADVVGRVSVLADDFAEVAELELNPVQARAGGVDILGARVVVARPAQRVDSVRRAMTT
ncbi:GNAT family N-acetyltransferase [Arsenicicoccus piscis]|uniref:bifunctional acetate--CoA ligase family protein/GNAT family N-acetyltransferase n=1 Tax=Arsenicicoccus piscis TaxID=673954 RepID=UPI001F4CE43C|nr:GNAT family N-acetyltransferase [Arsenicicoccus piscis]MCH8628594.1 GNAT family N-acetyltransferase [Arsenicicoccus piscis]